MSRTWTGACAAALGLWLAGCAGESGLTCDSDERPYTASDSIPPVRVPEGLSPPDQNDALQIPPAPPPDSPEAESGSCLETPPDYFDE